MQSTKAVRSLKKLFEGYHEPTLSKQQSQKLLDGLKSSFRGHLDREYGQSPGSVPSASKPNETANSSAPTRRSAAHQHLRELLSNPMFQYETGPTLQRTPLSSSVAVPSRDPMDVFDHAVSRDMMTLEAAIGILKAKRQQTNNTADGKTESKQEDITPRVVNWLHSTYDATNPLFLGKPGFTKAFVPFIVMEGQEEVIWDWFGHLIANLGPSSSSSVPRTSNDGSARIAAKALLRDLVHFKAGSQGSNNIDGAITSLLRADEIMPSNEVRDRILPQSWRSLSWFATVENFKTATASETLYDAHIDTGSRFGQQVTVETAHLHLYHPTHPDHTPAFRLFEDTQLVRDLVEKGKGTPGFVGYALAISPWIACLGRDTMNFLLRAGKTEEADHLAVLLESGLSSMVTSSDFLPNR